MKYWQKTIITILTGGIFAILFFCYPQKTQSAPLLANYYLNQLPHDNASLDLLAKNDLLVISPEQANTHKTEIDYIRRLNGDIIVLAYVPSQSYNTAHWPNDPIFKNFIVQESWWLKNAGGKIVEFWYGLPQLNMEKSFSDYLVDFCQTRIVPLPNVDGIFFDMVSDGISWAGEVDLNKDGINDDKKTADQQWVERVEYLLRVSRENLRTKYIVINGNSNPKFQPYVNGRMFEDFPASWDWGGKWSVIMNYLKTGKKQNASPKIMVINSGTGNTGDRTGYQQMRFGLASSLMEDDVYYSFDFGDKNHGQIWWYDEYGVNLGDATGDSVSASGEKKYTEAVWRRDYENGVAVVNPTGALQKVDLAGEYEKIAGKQDPVVNNGKIVEKVNLNSRDGVVMLKAYQNLKNTVFGNGDFVHFFDFKGGRVRNGFFAFDKSAAGGASVFVGDLNNDGSEEKIVGTGGRFEIFNSSGLHWFDNYPFGGENSKVVRFSVGKDLNNETRILVSSASDARGVLYNYHGMVIKADFYPFGEKYNAGFYSAFGNFDGGAEEEFVVGSGGSRVGEVLVFDSNLQKIKYRFFPFEKKFIGRIKVAAGDVDGDEKDEIITMGKFGSKNVVRVFSQKGKKVSEFTVYGVLGGGELNIGAVDVNFDGKDEIVVSGD